MTLRDQIQAMKRLSDAELLYLRAAIMFEFRRRQPEPAPDTNERLAAYWQSVFEEKPVDVNPILQSA